MELIKHLLPIICLSVTLVQCQSAAKGTPQETSKGITNVHKSEYHSNAESIKVAEELVNTASRLLEMLKKKGKRKDSTPTTIGYKIVGGITTTPLYLTTNIFGITEAPPVICPSGEPEAYCGANPCTMWQCNNIAGTRCEKACDSCKPIFKLKGNDVTHLCDVARIHQPVVQVNSFPYNLGPEVLSLMDLDLSDSIIDKMLQQNNHNNKQNNNNNNKFSQQKKNKQKPKGIKKVKPEMNTLRQIVQPKRKSKQNVPKEVKPKSLHKGLSKSTVTKTNTPLSARSNTVSIPVGSTLNVMTSSNGHSSVSVKNQPQELGYSISIPNQQNSVSYTNHVTNTNQRGNSNYHGNSNAQSNTNHQGNNNVQSSANQLLGPLLSSVLKVGQNQNGVLPIYSSVQTKSVQNVGNRNDLLSRLQNILTMRSSNSGVGHNLVQQINQNLIKASQKPIISIVPFRKKVKGPLGAFN